MHRECRIMDVSRMSNCGCVENVELWTCRECREFPKNPRKLKKSKKVVRHHYENEFFTFSTPDVSSNEFSKHQLDMSTLHVNVNLQSTLPTRIIIQFHADKTRKLL